MTPTRPFGSLHRQLQTALTAALGGALVGCDAIGAGPCEHTFRDPLVTVQSAKDSATGAPIPQLLLHSFTVRAIPQVARDIAVVPPTSRVALRGDTLVCAVVCGFGTLEGPWSFTATASGYLPRTVQATGTYPRFDGGCPSSNSGTVSLNIRLVRS